MAGIPCNWDADVEEYYQEAKKAVGVVSNSMRVPKALMIAKAEAYIPQMVSLGLYHRSLCEETNGKDDDRSQMELYKLKEIADKDVETIRELYTKIAESGVQFEQFYSGQEIEVETSRLVWLMMIDALFLFHFLSTFTTDISVPAPVTVRCDIVKLENQIPISLVKQVEIALESNRIENVTKQTLESQIDRLCCFQVGDPSMKIEKEKHLLGYMHKCISSVLRVEKKLPDPADLSRFQKVLAVMGNMVERVRNHFHKRPGKADINDFLPKYNAKELVKGGIQFQSFKGPGKIRFCRNSDTLYLPQITIADTYTEVLLRNLLALEFNDAGGEKSVTHYVELMDCLIDDKDDVTLLRKSNVIERQSMMITDEYVAKMWDGLSQPFFLAGFLESHGDLKAQIKEALFKNFYRRNVIQWMEEFHSEHLSSPWKFTALLIGIFVLGLTVVQTYCSVKECGGEYRPTVNGRKHFSPSG
ncbi:hypothetical protein SUGI_0436640 [Cryptomeria japonica]|uniref:putative UPF0481 protein At3g02645 n=1 Tax=Cryptomeria japonica TaxID=3369 RepID=UPI002408DD7C|nr:putative UPF0481 protein At3g02645 [Cryptomeria japonica]GLJ23141.1 hypothetical protein SUGI_0436640 [Cryptomeria japonica]